MRGSSSWGRGDLRPILWSQRPAVWTLTPIPLGQPRLPSSWLSVSNQESRGLPTDPESSLLYFSFPGTLVVSSAHSFPRASL